MCVFPLLRLQQTTNCPFLQQLSTFVCCLKTSEKYCFMWFLNVLTVLLTDAHQLLIPSVEILVHSGKNEFCLMIYKLNCSNCKSQRISSPFYCTFKLNCCFLFFILSLRNVWYIANGLLLKYCCYWYIYRTFCFSINHIACYYDPVSFIKCTYTGL
jgi:hypothetical protein